MINYLIPLQYAITPILLILTNILFLLVLLYKYTFLSNSKTNERIYLFKQLKLVRNAIIYNIISIILLLVIIIVIFIFSVFYCKFNEIIIILFISACIAIMYSIILFLLQIIYENNLFIINTDIIN